MGSKSFNPHFSRIHSSQNRFFWCLTLRGDARRAHLACDQSPAAGGHRADGGGVAEMIRRYDEMVIFGVSW